MSVIARRINSWWTSYHLSSRRLQAEYDFTIGCALLELHEAIIAGTLQHEAQPMRECVGVEGAALAREEAAGLGEAAAQARSPQKRAAVRWLRERATAALRYVSDDASAC